MVHALTLLLQSVSLPVVPALYLLLRPTGRHTTCVWEGKGHLEWVNMYVQALT